MRHEYFLRNGRHPAQRGFSLVELMVALALSSFLLGALILTYVSGRAASADAEGLARVQENMRFVSDHLLRDVRNAGFRDQLTLTFDEYIEIGESYARINQDGTELTIKYAGRSHCAQSRQAFNLLTELTVVQNRYFVDLNEGRLKCEGQAGGDPRTTDLVDGVSRVSFELLRPAEANPDDADVCNFDTSADLESACTGVAITLGFVGRRGSDDERGAVLSAAFRNVLVDRIYGRGP